MLRRQIRLVSGGKRQELHGSMGPDNLKVIAYAPLNAELPRERLREAITPAENVYVRTNFGVPRLDAANHEILVDGAVATSFSIRVPEVRQLSALSLTSTMECAGNDRLGLRPVPRGEPWLGGAISTAHWSGVALRALLERASISSLATEVLVEGADQGERADSHERVKFARSLPISDALAPSTLLALEMNGAPLTPEHGAPVRLVVPGWYGMASVKWVTRVSVLTVPYLGYFQTRRYIYQNGNGTEPVTRMRVKSIIVEPAEGSIHDRGTIGVWGWAWSGGGSISHVELAVGDGDWREVELEPSMTPHTWSRWQTVIRADRPGRYVLRSRATDSAGATQPEAPEWNQLGYGNNAIQPVVIEVRERKRTID
jgi:DMSO/TMAO reductase YedYZ molybdopterin-dependent catalytic subunit